MYGDRPRAQRHDAARQDGDDRQGGQGSRKKSDLLAECSSIATATSVAIRRDKRRTEERRGWGALAAGRGGGGDGEDVKRRGKRDNRRCLA